MLSSAAKVFRSALSWFIFAGFLLGNLPTPSGVRAGEMYRWVDDQGRIHLTDTPPRSTRQDVKIYRSYELPTAQDRLDPSSAGTGDAKLTPTKPGGVMIVEAVLNRRLTVPLMLDTGADYTIITQQSAQDLRIPSLARLPKLQLSTAGGFVSFPITTLQSLRVGGAEARDVAIAIDTGGHMPVGLLGMSFLRHFKVTVDQQRGRVTFAR